MDYISPHGYFEKENIDYVIKTSDEKSQSPIVIVDYENTGRMKKGSSWQNGIHQFLEVKHGFKPSKDSLTYAAISHSAFFAEYNRIYGLTGTVGEMAERKEMKKVYGIKTFDVPPHIPSKRITYSESYNITKESYYNAIYRDILSLQKQNRPALAVFKTIAASQEFSDFLLSKSLTHQVLNEVQQEDESYILSRAGKERAITVATTTAARGINVILQGDSQVNGGLGVLACFLTTNKRVHNQIAGRSARQGQNGSDRTILFSEDEEIVSLIPNKDQRVALAKEKNPLAILEKLRTKKVEALSQQRIVIAKFDTALYNLFKKFRSDFLKVSKLLDKLDISTGREICKKFDVKTTETFEDYNPILISSYKQAYGLLQKQQAGLIVDWDSFIKHCKEVYLQQLKQEWAEYFTEISDRSEFDLPNIKKIFNAYKGKLGAKFKHISQNPDKDFADFINNLLTHSVYYNEVGEETVKTVLNFPLITIINLSKEREQLISQLGGTIERKGQDGSTIIRISSNLLTKENRETLGIVSKYLIFEKDFDVKLSFLQQFSDITIETTEIANKLKVTFPKERLEVITKVVERWHLIQNEYLQKNAANHDVSSEKVIQPSSLVSDAKVNEKFSVQRS